MKELGGIGQESRLIALRGGRRSVETIPMGPCGSMAVLAGKVAHTAVMEFGPLMGPCRCLLFHSPHPKDGTVEVTSNVDK